MFWGQNCVPCYTNVNDKKVSTDESVTSSISRAEKYFKDAGTDTEQLAFFWYNVVRYGRLDVMEWAHRQRYSRVWNEQFHGRQVANEVCRKAAQYGQLDALQRLRLNGCSWDSASTCFAVADGGHLSVLEWARVNGCDWDRYTCSTAAGGGHLVLEWARPNGCDWNAMTCSCAAGGGHLSVLQWARENGCDWDIRTCFAAAGGGHLSVLQWAIEKGCIWDIGTYHAAKICGNPDVVNCV